MTSARLRCAIRVALACSLGGVVLATTAPAAAQTWVPERTTPHLGELVAVDATGERGWWFEPEDVAGDGSEFGAAERAVDLRTAYAATSSTQLWARLYVVEPAAPSAVTGFVFIDSDRNTSTGGSAGAAEVDPRLTEDPSRGGYETVIVLRGATAPAELWAWSSAQNAFTQQMLTPARAQLEYGVDRDPIGGADDRRGYLQARVDLQLVGLSQTCEAHLFFRSLSATDAGVLGDVDVGEGGPCIPSDADGDQVPDLLEPSGCNRDDQCPADGVCVDGDCVLPVSCAEDADCGAERTCTADGRCVPAPGPACTDDEECGDLVCTSGRCSACSSASDCGSGSRCAPTGRCVAGAPSGGDEGAADYVLGPDERVQGGACACRAAGQAASSAPLGWLSLLLLFALGRRQRSRC